MKPGDQPLLMVALDDGEREKVPEKAVAVAGEGNIGYKLNLDFFIPTDEAAFDYVLGLGKPVFVDLKMWNGKRTMKAVMGYIAGKEGVKFSNAYCHGGVKFLKDVKEVTEANGTQLLGLTVLTHYTDEDCQRMYGRDVAGSVAMLASIGQEADVDGLILPGTTLHVVRDLDKLKTVPGIRPKWYEKQKDNAQEQIVTPYDAVRDGADITVAGSPVFKSKFTPREALEKILSEMDEAYRSR